MKEAVFRLKGRTQRVWQGWLQYRIGSPIRSLEKQIPKYKLLGLKRSVFTFEQSAMWSTPVLTLTFVFVREITSLAGATDEQRLVYTIFANYDKTLRPVLNSSDIINVTLDPALSSIVQTNEESESITIVQWFRMLWKDVFIQWNPSDYGGLDQLLIPISQIWYPVVTVQNMISSENFLPDEKNYAIIGPDGSITISLRQSLTMNCKFDMIFFPFDNQNCTMSLGPWMFTAAQMDIYFKTPIDLKSFYINKEWNLISMTARRTKLISGASKKPFAHVYYDILIQRKPIYYLLTFVLPSFMITSISIIGMFAPFNDAGDREEKVTMGLTTLLTMSILLTLIADKMPKSSEGMPLLGVYIMLQIAISAATSLIEVLMMYQHGKWTTGKPIPAWIRAVTRLVPMKGFAKRITFSHSANFSKANDMKKVDDNLINSDKHILEIMTDIQSMVRHMIADHVYEQNQEQLRKDWQHETQRLELEMMFLFLGLNCFLTAGFLIIGYSNVINYYR